MLVRGHSHLLDLGLCGHGATPPPVYPFSRLPSGYAVLVRRGYMLLPGGPVLLLGDYDSLNCQSAYPVQPTGQRTKQGVTQRSDGGVSEIQR